MTTCTICRRIKSTYCRGVCWACYRKGHRPPVTSKFRPDLHEEEQEPSEEEIDAMIAERLPTMPGR